jgi:hypothetical protein
MEDAARADGNCTGNGNLPGLAEYFEHEFLRKQRGLLYSIHKTCPYGKEKWPWITTISGMCSNTGFRSTYDRSFDAAGMVRNTTLTEMLHLFFLRAHALKSNCCSHLRLVTRRQLNANSCAMTKQASNVQAFTGGKRRQTRHTAALILVFSLACCTVSSCELFSHSLLFSI